MAFRVRVFVFLFVCLLIASITLGSSLAAVNDSVGGYTFDNANLSAGNPQDVTGNGEHATNTTAATGQPGIVNTALYYDAANAENTTFTDLDMTGPFAISVWVNISGNTGANQVIVGKRSGSNNDNYLNYRIWATDAGAFSFSVGATTAEYCGIYNAGSWSANTWTNIMINVPAAGVCEFFQDNQSLGTDGPAGAIHNNNFPFVVGDNPYIGGMPFNGTIDELYFYNHILGVADRAALYNNGLGFQPYNNTGANASVTAQNNYTGVALTNFSVVFDGTNLSTTNGTVVLPIKNNDTDLHNLTYDSTEGGAYFPRTYTDVLAEAHTGSIHQAEITFNATNRVSSAVVTSFTANTSSNGGSATVTATNPQLNLTVGENYQFTFTKNDYYPSSLSGINVTALEQSTQNFSVHDHVLNVSVNVTLGGATDQNFSVDIYSLNWSFHERVSTTNGVIELNLTPGDYTLYLNDSIHVFTEVNLTLNTSVNWTNHVFQVFTTNSVFVEFRDQDTNALVADRNVTAYFTGGLTSYNASTSNGTMFLELIVPQEYTVTYLAPGYAQSEYVFTLTNGTNNELVLYLINDSVDTIVTVTVVNTLNQEQGDYLVSAQKKNLSGTNYYTVATCTTSGAGACILNLVLNTVTYRFSVLSDVGVSQTFKSTGTTVTEDQKVFSTDLTLVVDQQTGTVDDIFDALQVSGDVSYDGTDTFTYSWSDPNGLSVTACLTTVRRIGGAFSTLNLSCTSSASGTITQKINGSTGHEFIATGDVRIGGDLYVLDSVSVLTADFTLGVGAFGLFLFGFLVAGIAAFTGLWSPVVGPSLLVAVLFFAGYLGFISFGLALTGVVGSLLVLVIFVVKS